MLPFDAADANPEGDGPWVCYRGRHEADRGQYVFVRRGCTGLDGQTVTVISDFGGSAEAVIR